MSLEGLAERLILLACYLIVRFLIIPYTGFGNCEILKEILLIVWVVLDQTLLWISRVKKP